MESTINNGFLSDASQNTFATAMAKANTSSTSSLIADRSSNPTSWLSSLGLQGAFNSTTGSLPTSSSTDNSLPSFGAAVHSSLVVGVSASKLGIKKLGPFDPKRTLLMLNGMLFRKTVADVSLSFFNVGLNAQYKLVTPKGKSVLLQWGGLDFLTGFNFQSLSADYSSTISQATTQDVESETAQIQVDMDYTLGVKSIDFFVPLEISTNIRFLYLFTLYAGASADFNFGSSKLTGSATGPISATYSEPVPGVDNLYSATGSLNLDGGVSQSPDL